MNKKSFYQFKNLCTFFLFLVAFSCQKKTENAYKVIGVKDGDTIVLLQNDQPLTVRLYGVDCPEKKQDFGTQAKNFTAQLAFGKYVKLNDKGKDRYGRTI